MPPKRNRPGGSSGSASGEGFGESKTLIIEAAAEAEDPATKKRRLEPPATPTLERTSSLTDDDDNKPKTAGVAAHKTQLFPSGSQGAIAAQAPVGVIATNQQWLNFEELKLGEEIGAGAFGSVYKGVFRGTDVAIKILHSQDKNAELMFLKEADIMFKLRHPNIVQFMGACVTPPNCCIVMDLYPKNLAAEIKKGIKDMIIFHRIIMGIAKGLNYLHMATPQVIHRDLKPGNILLDHGFTPRIADFGVSRETKANATMTRIGTPTYCAPEVLNSEHYTSKVDIYSFGMLVFAMSAGGSPWKSENLSPIQVMMRIAVKKERPPIPSDCRSDIKALIIQAWQHNPNERPDAAGLIKFIEAINPDKPPPPEEEIEATQLITPSGSTMLLSQTVVFDQPTPKNTSPPPQKKQTQSHHHNQPQKAVQPNATQHASSNGDVVMGGTNQKPLNTSYAGPNMEPCQFDASCYRFKLAHRQEAWHPVRDAYENYLKSFLKNGFITKQQRQELNDFRFRPGKHVSDKAHQLILGLNGWTVEEFENGALNSQDKKRKRDS